MADIRQVELSQRKRNILRRVIEQYVRNIHPVSSQSVAREMNVSSATVRNELSALEEWGYLQQLHTSGGRLPTDRAYRFWVEELVSMLAQTLGQRRKVAEVYSQLGRETEALLEGTLDLLTQTTGFVAWVCHPVPSALDIKGINFVVLDTHELLVVLVTGSGALQSKVVRTGVPVKDLAVGSLSEKLNNYLTGRRLTEIDYGEIRRIFSEVVGVPGEMLDTLKGFFSGLACGADRVLFSDAIQLVLQPEFNNVAKLSELMNVLNDTDRFAANLREQLGSRALDTIIGAENSDPNLRECSLVLARLQIPSLGDSSIGVIGPTRQDYGRTLSWVKSVGESIAQVMGDLSEGRTGE